MSEPRLYEILVDNHKNKIFKKPESKLSATNNIEKKTNNVFLSYDKLKVIRNF